MRTLILLLFLAFPAHADMAVTDGDTIRIGDDRYRINGIDAPERGQTCGGGTDEWRCGEAATDRLKALVTGKALDCTVHEVDDFGRFVATCRADGVDVGQVMVREGLAWSFLKFTDIYETEEAAARVAGLGIWRVPSQPAWEYRSSKWEFAKQVAPDGCPIKGNISNRGRIYHTPWSQSYARTKITAAKGERWFCDEAEAVAAGWRAPLN